ncbi:TPA: tail fiber protein, partial [Escherichia coli]
AQTDLTSVGRDIIGKNTIADILTYLGLGDGSALPVGVPVPWPLPNPPQGWLKYNGAPFDKIMFPKLGAIYPSGILPDLRGEFIRGWDDGRGVDSGRTLLSEQVASSIGRFVSGTSTTGAVGTTVYDLDGTSPGDSSWAGVATGMTTKTIQQQRDAVRPRNIAFNYIVRAA